MTDCSRLFRAAAGQRRVPARQADAQARDPQLCQVGSSNVSVIEACPPDLRALRRQPTSAEQPDPERIAARTACSRGSLR
jgi:hypothetical protein